MAFCLENLIILRVVSVFSFFYCYLMLGQIYNVIYYSILKLGLIIVVTQEATWILLACFSVTWMQYGDL